MKTPLISIIIVNWNGKRFLKDCFDSLVKQEYKNIEIIFVDNASSDDSVNFVKKNYSKKLNLKIIKNKENYGFAKANNIGAKIAKGEFLLLLNNDTKVPKNTLDIIMKEYPKLENPGAVGCILKNFDGSSQNKGFEIDQVGYPVGIAEEKMGSKKHKKIFYPTGAFFFIKKEKYLKLRGLDENYFMYMEEVDLCWRLLLNGYNNYALTKCFIYHYGGGTSKFSYNQNNLVTNKLILYQREKNTLNMLIKNYSTINLIKYIPLYLIINCAEILYWLLKFSPSISWIYVKSWIWNISKLKNTLHKRKIIQKKRAVSDKKIKKLQIKSIVKFKLFSKYGFNVQLK
ncbi:MAG: glycosyltransferase family 2 protein [Candidatus Nanoarchaeia archaeon]|nr:glycosyltransferase family 2 protein [Candidatus Nanoarchaeia archaeon]